MASVGSSVPNLTNHGTKKTEMDVKLVDLMEKLRSKSRQLKTWSETTKAVRMAMSDKRHQSEVVDKTFLQKCLDHLQKAMKVTNQSSIVEKLSSIARSLGFKFTSVSNGTDCYISTESFYVEIKMETNGKIKEVNVNHGTDNKACPELVKVLRDGNFDEFTEHLEGLAAIYKIGGDKKQKTRSYVVLQSLEADLNQLSQLQNSISGVSNYIHKSPLGIVQPRVGGLPMKLIYFVAPYNLLNPKTKSSYPMTVEAILENKLGHSVTVGIESSPGHRLQTVRLMTVSKTADGKNLPSFPPLNNQNSSMLCACFVLTLQTPIPVSLSILQKIQKVTGIEFFDSTKMQSLMALITEDMFKGKMTYDSGKGLYVTLKDQHHCYHVSEPSENSHMVGTMISRIQFTHPTHVPKILIYLRQQLIFNTFLSSCVRPLTKRDRENSIVFEVIPISLHHISVTFEHPVLDSMSTVEFDLNDMTSVKAKLMSLGSDEPICPDDFICKVIQRCLSIPVTMRMIMMKARAQLAEMETKAAEANALMKEPPPPTPLERRFSFPDGPMYPPMARPMNTMNYQQGPGPLQPMPIPNMPPEPTPMQLGQPQNFNVTPTSLGSFDYDTYGFEGQPKQEILDSIRAEKVAKNPMLASLLDQDNDSPEAQGTLLPNLLTDNPPNQPILPKPRKVRKRKATSDARSPGSSSGKSPKRKFSEEEFSNYGRQLSTDLPSIPSLPMVGSVESNDPFEIPMPDMQQMRTSTSQLSTPTTPIDQPSYHTESHVTKLASSLDNIIKQETKNLPSCQQGELAALLSDTTDDCEKLAKKLDLAPPPKAIDTSAGPIASTSGVDNASTINIAGIQSKNDLLATTLDDIINNVASGTTPLDPEIFTNKEGMVFVAGQLIGDGAMRPLTSAAMEAQGVVNQATLPPQDFDTDPLEFNTELLNPEGTFTETENSEEMDLEACDANAFGVTLNPAVVASKLTASGSTPPSQPTQTTPTTAATCSSTASTPTTVATSTPMASALTSTEAKAQTPSEKKPEKDRKEHKDKEKVKEKKESNNKDEKLVKKVAPKPILTVKIGSETTHTPSPQEALDLSTCTKEQKSSKSKSAKQPAEGSEEHSDRPIYTSATTGSGTSIVISAKSSPAHSSNQSSGSSAKIISSKDNLLKMSVKKDKLKHTKDSKEDLKRKKDSSKKDKSSKKRKIEEDGKVSSYQAVPVKDSSSSKSKSEHKPSTKIKITTSGGQMRVQTSTKVTTPTDGSSKPKSLTPQKTSSSLKPMKSSEKNPPLQLKIPSSKISSHSSSTKVTKKYTSAQNITVSKGDSKLMTKTPTIKLKPLRIPSSASSSTFTLSTKNTTPTTSTTTKVSAPSNMQKSSSTPSKLYGQKTPTTPPLSKIGSSSASPATKYVPSSTAATAKPSTPVTPTTPTTSTPSTPTQTTPSSGTPPVGPLGKGKSPMRSRSLSAVIDKLTKTQSQSSSQNPGSGDSPNKSGEKKDSSGPNKSSGKRDEGSEKSKSDSHRSDSSNSSSSQKERLKPNILSKSFGANNPLKRPETAKLDISKLPKIPKLDPNKKKDLTPTTVKSVLPVPPKPSTLSSTGGNNSSKMSHGNSDKSSSGSDKMKSDSSSHSGEKSRSNMDQAKKMSSIASQKSSIQEKVPEPKVESRLPEPKPKEPVPEPSSFKPSLKEDVKEPEKCSEKSSTSGRLTPDIRQHGRNTPDGRRTPDNGLKDKVPKDNNNKILPPVQEKDQIDTESLSKQILGDKVEYFKQPTPKTQKTEPKARPSERIGPTHSPQSAPSSPEDSLIIDCPSTPRSRDIGRSPVPTTSVSGTRSPALLSENRFSPVPPKSPASHDSPLVKKSPISASPLAAASPKVLSKPITSPISNPSPCMIDDDLMDEAVMGLGD